MKLSPIQVVALFAKNGILLGAMHRVLGNQANKSDYNLTQNEIDTLGKDLDKLHQRAGYLLTPEGDDKFFGFEIPKVTQEDRIERHQKECQYLNEAVDDLRTLYRLSGLYAPSSWQD